MAILSVAITLTFHLAHQPSDLERRMAKPLGLVFWLLSVATLIGLGNYISMWSPRRAPSLGGREEKYRDADPPFPAATINKYGRRVAIVQTGWRTQLVRRLARPVPSTPSLTRPPS